MRNLSGVSGCAMAHASMLATAECSGIPVPRFNDIL